MQRNSKGQFIGNGINSGRWAGGTISQQGYICVFMPENNLANTKGYVRLHRLVMQNHLNRPLKSSEIVHHLNHDKKDNRIENLVILTRGEHPKLHNQRTGRWSRLYEKCINCGTTEIHHEVGGRCYKCYYKFKNKEVYWKNKTP